MLSAKIQGELEYIILTTEPASYVWMLVKKHIYSHTWAAKQLDAFGILKTHSGLGRKKIFLPHMEV